MRTQGLPSPFAVFLRALVHGNREEVCPPSPAQRRVSYAIGRVTVKQVPSPRTDSTVTSPPMASVSSLTRANPTPAPVLSDVGTPPEEFLNLMQGGLAGSRRVREASLRQLNLRSLLAQSGRGPSIQGMTIERLWILSRRAILLSSPGTAYGLGFQYVPRTQSVGQNCLI